MSININALASSVKIAGVSAETAIQLVEEVISLIGVAEQIYEGLKGDQKLQLVLAGLEGVVAQLGLSDKLAMIEKALRPLINVVVELYNLRNLWPSFAAPAAQIAQAAQTAAQVAVNAAASFSSAASAPAPNAGPQSPPVTPAAKPA